MPISTDGKMSLTPEALAQLKSLVQDRIDEADQEIKAAEKAGNDDLVLQIAGNLFEASVMMRFITSLEELYGCFKSVNE